MVSSVEGPVSAVQTNDAQTASSDEGTLLLLPGPERSEDVVYRQRHVALSFS